MSPGEARTLTAHTRPHADQPLTHKGRTSAVEQVAVGPDGMQLASASTDGTIKVWDARSEPEARTFEGRTVAFSPDGRSLASTSWAATTFKLWDTRTGQEIHTFDGHKGMV